MADLMLPLSPIARHIKPIAVELSEKVSKKSTQYMQLSLDKTFEFLIQKYIVRSELAVASSLEIERVIFEDNSSCYAFFHVQEKDGIPTGIYLALGSKREPHYIAGLSIND